MISVSYGLMAIMVALLIISLLAARWLVDRGASWASLTLIAAVTGWVLFHRHIVQGAHDEWVAAWRLLTSVIFFAPLLLGLVVGHLWGRVRALR